VRRLFEAEEITFTEFLLATRLSYAHRLLCVANSVNLGEIRL